MLTRFAMVPAVLDGCWPARSWTVNVASLLGCINWIGNTWLPAEDGSILDEAAPDAAAPDAVEEE